MSGTEARQWRGPSRGARSLSRGRFRTYVWEQDQVADRRDVGEHDQQPVDPDPDPTGRWHPVLERRQEVLVERMGLLVARRLRPRLSFELRTLFEAQAGA